MANHWKPSAAGLWCAALLLVFALLSWLATASKSPTADEPQHALAAWTNLHLHDYRLDPEDPPLWMDWAALPNGPDAVHLDRHSEEWNTIGQYSMARVDVIRNTLWHTAGNNGDELIRRSRAMMPIFGILLGVLIARWSWILGGAAAAVCATFAYALDPNFLGHASLVKNDVPVTCAAMALYFATWRVGQRVTWPRAIALIVLSPVALGVKFSAVPLVGLVIVLVFIRAILPQPWPVLRQTFTSRGPRLLTALAITTAILVVSYISIWAMYEFRFAPSRDDPAFRMSINEMAERKAANAMLRADPDRMPTTEEARSVPRDLVVRSVIFLQRHRLFPQAWLWGFLYQYATSLYRATYLMGTRGTSGWWYYFPLAMLFKTPVATLAAMLMAAIALMWPGKHSGDRGDGRSTASLTGSRAWTRLCLCAPPLIYFIAAMNASLNLGLRHVFPTYSFLFIAIGLGAARLWQTGYAALRGLVVVLGLMLAIESVSAFPNYIAFFNFAAGGTRNGHRLLLDSNLDWGQDLLMLADWQARHSEEPLYLAYDGPAEPAFYGIRYYNLLGSDAAGPIVQPRAPCYVAISANILHGLYSPKEFRNYYMSLSNRRPDEVLGGSIFIYDFRNVGAGGRRPGD